MSKVNQNRQPSVVAQKAYEQLENAPVDEIGGITSNDTKTLHFFAKHIAGFEKYNIHILFAKEPKEIVFEVFDKDFKPLYVKMKNPEALDRLSQVISGEYVIRFATKEDYFGTEDDRSDSKEG